MVDKKSIDFLPQVFRTSTNSRFLNATVDQLIQEPNLNQIFGYIGRKNLSPSYKKEDAYIQEDDSYSQYYQLEPGLVINQRVAGTNKFIKQNAYSYIDLLNGIALEGGINNNHSRLFANEYYNYEGFVDLDKLVNYGKYYWIANGPKTLEVNGKDVVIEETFNISRPTSNSNSPKLTVKNIGYVSYSFDTFPGKVNPDITLVRGGFYTFNVNQPGNSFWIQLQQGLSPTVDYQDNINNRDVYGVSGNGSDQGIVTFKVPTRDEQNSLQFMNKFATIDFVTELPFNVIQNADINEFLINYSFDGVKSFTNGIIVINNEEDGKWWDPRNSNVIPTSQRKGLWKFSVVNDRIQLDYLRDWTSSTKIFVNEGRKYGNINIVKTAQNQIIAEPNITSTFDTFYYQDGTDESVYGKIIIVDEDPELAKIDVSLILGQKDYISPNRIVFTNGLKVKFTGNVVPESYKDQIFVVEGVGKSIKLIAWQDLVTPDPNNPNFGSGFSSSTEDYDETDFDITVNAPIRKDYIVINRGSHDGNGWSRTNRWFHEDVIKYATKFNNPTAPVILDNANRATRPIVEFDANLQLWNNGNKFITAVTAIDAYTTDIANQVEGRSPYVLVDSEGNYYSDNVSLQEGAKVIFLNERYQNTRGQIFQVQNINPHTPTTLTKSTVKFEMIRSTRLHLTNVTNLLINMAVTGTNIPDNTAIMSIDKNNNTIELNNAVTNDVAVGTTITFSSNLQQVHLVPIHTMQQGELVVAVGGDTEQNSTYWWNNGDWQYAQEKNSLNQAPLFDIFNLDGFSLGDLNFYPSSTFRGSKLFGYKLGHGSIDTELGIPLSYKNIGNIGDIQFENFYDTDQFHFNYENTDQVLNVSIGYVHEIEEPNVSHKLRNNWVKINDLSKQYIERKTTVVEFNNYSSFVFDIGFINSFNEKNIFVYVNEIEINRSQFQIYGNETKLQLDFNNPLKANDEIIVRVYGKSAARENFTLPKNLVDNSINESFDSLTLGQIRNHLQEIAANSLDFVGNSIGSNNLRDIEYKTVPGKILQHSAGVHVAQIMFNNETTNIIKAIDFSRRSYSRFKDRFFHLISTMEFGDTTNERQCLDTVLEEITLNSSNEQSFYYTDMVPFGSNDFIVNHYSIFDTNYRKFNLIDQFDINTPTYNGVLVYLNGNQLIMNHDYTMDGNNVVLDRELTIEVDDVLSVYEYPNTKGCMIPATPTKLGLYPKFIPQIYADETFIADTVDIIQSHDGSRIVAFGDYRDNIILEFEKRIYNNIFVEFSNDARTCFTGIEPGAFRNTDYDINEWTQLLSSSFLSWAGSNNVNVFENNAESGNPFTYNYSGSRDKIFGENVPGHWRGVFKYFYDTDRPNIHPWEMLGLSEKPLWWEERYGPAPYSAGNDVLWQDLEMGLIYQHGYDSYIDSRYTRPGLSMIIPVDDHGDLKDPAAAIINGFDLKAVNAPWRFGDQSPQETAWRRSSDYPFAVQIAWALARPAQYCTLSLNRRDLVRINLLDQIINVRTSNRKLNLLITDDTQYIPGSNIWIRDRLVDLNLDITTNFAEIFDNFNLNLLYKVSGYTDKKYLTVIAEQASPNSNNSGIMIPQENYDIVFTKSAPVGDATYSGIIIEKTGGTFTVYGFDTAKPYFTIIPRRYEGNSYAVSVSKSSAKIYTDDEQNIQIIPYGTQFATKQQVVDFLISYGRFLNKIGFQFNDISTSDVANVNDWTSTVKEFLFLLEQGWVDNNTVISLTPSSTEIIFDSKFGVVDDIMNSFNDSRIINSDGRVLQRKDYITFREGSKFKLQVRDKTKGIHLIKLNVVHYEHTLVFDNTTIFNDIIYQPNLGNRQSRLKLSGFRTREWNGSLYAPGFLVNHRPVDMWTPMQDYYKGDIVEYKNKNYTAKQFIPGTSKFEDNNWYVVESKILDRQLIMNLASGAEQIEHFYDVNEFDVNRSADSLARNSTGFVPRSYMNDIGLDNVSQHKFYLGMIREKGTQAVIDAFMRARLPYLDNGVKVSEQWAIRLGNYGGLNNKTNIEVSLKNAKIYNGSHIIEFNSDQFKDTRWNAFGPKDLLIRPPSYTPTIFAAKSINSQVVATSGPVLTTEVDATVFDIQKIQNINILESDMGEGSRIWVASDKKNEWDVYRVTADTHVRILSVTVVGNEIEFSTDKVHNLSINDNILIKDAIVAKIDMSGFYRVNSVMGKTFKVPLYVGMKTTNGRTDSSLTASVFKLKSVRYNHKGRFALNTPGRGWAQNDTVWVDGLQGNWEVLRNTSKWVLQQYLTPRLAASTDTFGTEIDIKTTQDIMIVGAPGKGTGGYSYIYRQNSDNTWSVIDGVKPADAYALEFGYSVKYSDINNVVVGAPGSLNQSGLAYILTTSSESISVSQVLNMPALPSNSRFGHSVTISKDGQFVAVGAPGIDSVYIFRYNEVAVPISVTYTVGSKKQFQIPSSVINNSGNSNNLKVYLNNNLLVPYLDYYILNGVVILSNVEDQKIINDNTLFLYLDADPIIVAGSSSTTTWIDSSYKQNSATLVGTPYYSGIEGTGSYLFDGSSQYATISSTLMNVSYSGKTIFAVCKMSSEGWTTGVAQTRAIFGNAATDLNLKNFDLYVSKTTGDDYSLQFNVSGSQTSSGTIAIEPDQWMIVAVTQDTTSVTYYFNGIKVREFTGQTLNPYRLGGVESVGKANTYWDGEIAVCALYARTLTASEIRYNYNIFAERVGLNLVVTNDLNQSSDILRIVYSSGYSYASSVSINNSNKLGSVFRIINQTVSTVEINLGFDNLDFDSYSWDHADDLGSFGSSISFSTDGSQLLIGAPTSTPTIQEKFSTAFDYNSTLFEDADTDFAGYVNKEYQRMGAAYVYNHDKETIIADGINSRYTLDTLPINPKVYIDGIETKSFFIVSDLDITRIQFEKVVRADSIITVETNIFELLEIKLPTKFKNETAFGSKVLICPNTCSLYIGAPGVTDTGGKGNGAVFRFVNSARVYGSISGQTPNPTVTIGDSIRLNGIKVTFTGTSLTRVVADINAKQIPGVTAAIVNDSSMTKKYLIINSDSTIAYNRLNLSLKHGTSTLAYVNLGLNIFDHQQTLVSPLDQETARFGDQLALNPAGTRILIGATRATGRLRNTFDNGNTTFDIRSTKFNTVYYKSGSAYLYEYQGDAYETQIDHGNFVFAQQFTSNNVREGDYFGTGVALGNNWSLVSALAGQDNAGMVYSFYNQTGNPNWQTIRSQRITTDSRNIERIYLYNNNTKTIIADLPVIDPEHGMPVPSAAEQIKYTVNYDPAVYTNTPNGYSFATDPRNAWGKEHVGELWWDTNQIKFHHWNQGDLLTRFNNWGLSFPNSYVSVYEWIESEVSPANYTNGSGPLYTSNEVYTVKTMIDEQSLEPVIKYYFWVANSDRNDAKLKRNTASELQTLISNPRNITDPFAAVIGSNAVALYNCQDIVNDDMILHISLKSTTDSNPIHNEWGMFDDGSDLGIATEILDRMNDSLAGFDEQGRTVPDEALSEKQKYGINLRPRQTTYVDKFDARKTWIQHVNDVFLKYPMVLLRDISPLFDFDPVPLGVTLNELGFDTISFSGFGWDIEQKDVSALTVDHDYELDFLDKNLYYYKQQVTVLNDSTINGWSVRELAVDPANINGRVWQTIRVKKYDLRDYWSFVDWYSPQYNENTTVTKILDYEYEISRSDPQIGDIYKIKNGSNGNWKLVVIKENSVELVGQQNATLQFNSKLYDNLAIGFGMESQSIEIVPYAKDAAIEFRKIFDIVNYQLLNKEFREDFKNIVKVMIDKIANQFKLSDWLLKTSFIDVKHHVRSLDQIPVFVKQPETAVTEFIKEVKPYHTKIKQYLSSYDKLDLAAFDITDFDLPAYYNNATYKSPNLGDSSDVNVIGNISSIEYIDVISNGNGYVDKTDVIIEGDGDGAHAVVQIQFGKVVGVEVIKGGSGYTYANIRFTGSGTGATAITVFGEVKAKPIYQPWLDNHTYSVDYIDVFDGGQGYDENTIAIIEGDGQGATAKVYVQYGKVTAIEVTNCGYGYTNVMSYKHGVPIGIKIVGSGTGARAYATLTDSTSRTFMNVIKFDRTTYKSTTKDWIPNTIYTIKDIITHKNKAYRLLRGFTSGNNFTLDNLVELSVRVWKPNQKFGKNSIIVYRNNPYVAVVDFTSGRNFEYESNTSATGSRDWQPSTDYINGQILNYNNVAYRVLVNFTSPAIFDVDHLVVTAPIVKYLGGYYDDAASRVWSYYNPAAGMPGKDLSQVMKGISYPGVNVIGPEFDQNPGFGFGLFEQIGYDLVTVDSDGIENIYGKGTQDTNLYSLYTDTQLGTRPEDMITMGGSYVDVYNSHAPEEFVPGYMFDSLSLRVKTLGATSTSDTPEVAIVSYYADGIMKLYSFDTALTGVDLPIGGIDNIIVYNDSTNVNIQYLDVDYTIDWQNKTIEFTVAPSGAATIIIYMIGNSGKNLVADRIYTGDGSQIEFVVDDAPLNIQQAYVKVNNVPSTGWVLVSPNKQVGPLVTADTVITEWEPATFYTVDSYVRYNNKIFRATVQHSSVADFNKDYFVSGNTVVVKFDTAPSTGAVIDVHLFDLPIEKKAYSEIRPEIFVIPSTYVRNNLGYTIELAESVEYAVPAELYVTVLLNGVELEPPNQNYYTGDNFTRTFNIISTRRVSNPQNITYADLTITVDGKSLIPYTDYTFSAGVNPTVTLAVAPLAGANIVISNKFNAAFTVYDKTLFIKPGVRLSANDKIYVKAISSNEQFDMRRQIFSGSTNGTTLIPTYILSRPVKSLNNINVSLNGNWLSPLYNFNLISPTKLRIDPSYNAAGITETDIVVITYMSDDTRSPDIEYRIFKGINETYDYIGIGSKTKTKITSELKLTDEWIYVENISVLSVPDIKNAKPGIIFINGERITFEIFDEINSRLGRLRRATNGTGAPAVHMLHSTVYDGGKNALIPNTADTYLVTDKKTIFVGKAGSSVTVKDGTVFRKGKLWLDPGQGVPANGLGLLRSSAAPVQFLKGL